MSMTELTRKIAFSLALALGGLSMAPLAMAQETAPAAPAAPAADALAMGTAANAAPAQKTKETAAVGEPYLAQIMDAWELRCSKTESGADPCQLYQLLKDGQGNSVAEFSMFALPEGGKAAAGATVIAPLETLLTANLLIAIDDSAPKVYPFTFCAQVGCVARVGFTAEEVAQFQKGSKALLTIVPAAAPDQKVVLELSLKGFTAGYDAVKASAPKP